MTTLYFFFASVIVLELLSLAGIVVAFRKLHLWKDELMQARIRLSRFRFEMTRTLKTGQKTAEQADKIAQLVLGFAPPWVKVAVGVVRWLGKISPKTS